MAISSELISEFVKITNDTKTDEQKETTVYGTVKEYSGSYWVQLDGSDQLTPISMTTDVKPDERVMVMIKNHTATVTGNISSPAARSKDVQDLGGKVEDAGSKISEFEIIMSYSVTTDDLTAINATIDNLRTKLASVGKLEAITAEIETLEATFANLEHVSATDIEALNAEIENIRAKFGDFTDISTDDLDALNAEIDNLRGYTADFTYVSADRLSAFRADIEKLNTDKLSAKDAELKYANIDFTNIGEAAIKKLFSDTGLIKDLVVGDGTITGELVGVTIKGDLIEGNTVKADKLVVKGSDGLYYKLNFEGGKFAEGEAVPTDSLHGSVITAKSITAEKVSVKDLVAFGATIGGFNITDNSIYSGTKNSADNTTQGIYLDDEGQISIGDGTNYLKYYKDQNGNYKLSLAIGNSKPIDESLEDIQSLVEVMRDEVATVLRIDSSRGTVFKNNQVSTVLSAVIYHGSKRITDIATLKEEYGNGAYLEWKWQKIGETTFGTILSTDSRIGDDGFTFTLSPEDVDTKVVFMCQLMTD